MRGLSRTYVLKRTGMFFLTVWIGMTVIFFIPRMAPGDPIAAMVSRLSAQAGRIENADQMINAWHAKFGLDAPLPVQYGRFLKNMFTLNLGYSLGYFPTKVEDMIKQALPWTLGLLAMATLMSFVLGNIIGALLAWRRSPRLLKLLLPVTLTFTSIPPFMMGILLLYVFAFGLNFLPFSGGFDQSVIPGLNLEFIGNVLQHGILPASSIVVCTMGFWALGMRGMMITTGGEDFVILAEAKGLSMRRIFFNYEMRNAMLPQLTALTLSLGSIAGGSVIIEYIFTYPGIGYLLYSGIVNNDFTLIQGIVFVLISSVSFAVLLIDLLYPLIDPRISYQGK
ncbi:MAG: ABC transporter permease [Candidatus Raymondbacteria bacterium RifOxyA12_full_50_37]|uniref:ABC transporter permease n=1 Tax=Candidatus Raymondbacteria bacterium RIFOXYD12_FULL_49_13 TaxID=1817890 RepID=A0A1F7F2Z7_UNCRA|nr:MAG: ABC transporter permease [Candidatus Raymondbacteria bacterium RifOxyA12_full_50_37]OGJ92775.1 MAG: ABC transporter permease [Candidatus Raymondbacteria bacterium RIFOXYA2_FULL_49_16]OGK00284.1 MAG: ABC transporter permease [Candidatus Raymondbacteria bacterium RifOxyB12_full_50_8]OGK00978.1 MAG: ABC transporter permease [Candidatus Raymondbacteria bacterium RIFOXYD12_FULL_49_13]OGK02458.1 MAG: ABC transporter permease [Candidatus Raymondbacteria bacterium RifOxyC12_full_50_8]OGP44551.